MSKWSRTKWVMSRESSVISHVCVDAAFLLLLPLMCINESRVMGEWSRTNTHTHINTHTQTHKHAHTHTHTLTHTHTHTDTDTHTHTPAPPLHAIDLRALGVLWPPQQRALLHYDENMSKETYICQKRPIYTKNHPQRRLRRRQAHHCGGGVSSCQKRPVYTKRGPQMWPQMSPAKETENTTSTWLRQWWHVMS